MKPMNERKITMADKSRERNYVDLFSDYGLDERQIAIQNKIMTKCFKLMYNSILILTMVWFVFFIYFKIEISNLLIVLSYVTLIVICQSIYAVMASKKGVINGITATTNSNGTMIVTAVIYIPVIASIISKNVNDFNAENIFMIVYFGIFAINCVIQYMCGKRNFKTLDQQGKEDSEEE